MKKDYGFDKSLPYKKRKNIPPLEMVPEKVWCIQLKDSESILEVFPIHNALVFTSESVCWRYLNAMRPEEKINYRVTAAIITTEKYIKNRVKRALQRKSEHE